MSDITVITPAISTRFDHLRHLLNSIESQTLKPAAHLISVDYDRVGCAANMNRMVAAVETEFMIMIADDDIMYPTCLERLRAEIGDHDMIYPWTKVVGRGNWNPNSHFDSNRLRHACYIPGMYMLRTEVWRELGGAPNVICEDYAFQLKMLDANKKIKCLPEILWEYRFHGSNISDGHDPKEI